MSPKFVGLLWILAAALIAAGLAAGLGPLLRLVPWSLETRLAQSLPALPFQDCRPSRALDTLSARLHPLLPDDYRFSLSLHLIHEPAVNAFAFLGGEIYINSGLVDEARSPDEVAGVIAHEIGHLEHRDVLQGLASQLMLTLVFSGSGWSESALRALTGLRFTRQQEEAADQAGLRRLEAAHISANGLADFFDRLPSGEFLSDHPDSRRRAEKARQLHVESSTPALSEAQWRDLRSACH